jgi:hypothetical protein
MSESSSYVLIKGDRYSTHYDHNGAGDWPTVFAKGPEAVEAYVAAETKRDTPVIAGRSGGVLIDFDLKFACCFGRPWFLDDEDHRPPAEVLSKNRLWTALLEGPMAFLKLSAAQWSGYTLVWDDLGAAAFEHYLKGSARPSNAPPRVVLGGRLPERREKLLPLVPESKPREGVFNLWEPGDRLLVDDYGTGTITEIEELRFGNKVDVMAQIVTDEGTALMISVASLLPTQRIVAAPKPSRRK